MPSLVNVLHPSLKVGFFQVGRDAAQQASGRHHKSIPFTIVARATRGTYDVKAHDWHVHASPGGGFVVPPHTHIDIGQTSDDEGWFALEFIHLQASLFGGVDLFSCLDIPPLLTP